MSGRQVVCRRQFLVALGGAALRPSGRATHAARGAERPRRHWPAVQRALDGFVAERKAPGAAVAVAFGDGPVAYPAAGTIAHDSVTRFDENSICRMYSITKNVTRTAAILLVEDGKITLDQPVHDVLPEFRSLRVCVDIEKGLESRPATRTMTIRHLLTDTSGLGNWTPGSDSGDPLHALYRERGITPGNFGARLNRPGYGPQVKSLREMIERVAELPLAYEPGTVLHYSIGFDVIALVIERVTGTSLDVFLARRVFEQLGMESTGFQVARKNAGRLTTNYEVSPDGLRVTDAGATSSFLRPPALLSGGGGLLSTARDFARYTGMLLGEGALERVRVMKPETARLVFSDLRPPGVAVPSGRVGEGTRAVRLQPVAPSGTFSGAGASGTLFWVDRARRGYVVFLVQTMGYTPATTPYPSRLIAALEEDLARR